jgi:hypothetical protein
MPALMRAVSTPTTSSILLGPPAGRVLRPGAGAVVLGAGAGAVDASVGGKLLLDNLKDGLKGELNDGDLDGMGAGPGGKVFGRLNRQENLCICLICMLYVKLVD